MNPYHVDFEEENPCNGLNFNPSKNNLNPRCDDSISAVTYLVTIEKKSPNEKRNT